MPSKHNISGTGVDKFFLLAIVAKALFGLGEVLAGLGLLAGARRLAQLVLWIETQGSNGLITFAAHYLLTFITKTGTVPDALLLLAHGGIKIFLIVGILRNKLWAYLWMIIAMAVFVVSEVVQGALTGQAGMYAIAATDLIILVLTIVEWRRHRRGRGLRVGPGRRSAPSEPAPHDDVLLKIT